MKILTVVGARPQFIKASAVSRALLAAKWAESEPQELLVHTGQHYDDNMSGAFFRELDIPQPTYHLGIGGLSHGALTGRLIEGLEAVMEETAPAIVLVYGDTNSTLAGALAAAKLKIPVAHVEAGLRSFNRQMPEEINRVVADHISSLLFCPTTASVANLADEGLRSEVYLVGDVMYDVALRSVERARDRSVILGTLGLARRGYALATVHRQENTDSIDRLAGILKGLTAVARHLPVVLSLHPRTRRAIANLGWESRLARLQVVDPLPYLDMVAVESNAAVIYTDSGGVQKEAYFYRVPCVTLRAETEWLETLRMNWNTLADADPEHIENALKWALSRATEGSQETESSIALAGWSDPYGDGHAADRIAKILSEALTSGRFKSVSTVKQAAL